MSAITTDVEQRTEWLQEFQDAHQRARWALGALNGQADTLSEAGLSGVASTLTGPLDSAWKAVTDMDAAISRMVSEDFQHSMKTTDDVFRALLGSFGNDHEQGREDYEQ